MNKRLFLATTAAVAIATSAFAQSSPSSSSSSPTSTERQQNSAAPSSSTSTPANNAAGSAQNGPSTNSAQTQSPSSTTAGQSSNSGTTSTTQAPASNNSNNQAQPANSNSTNQTQNTNPASSNTNQARSPDNNSTDTAQQLNNQQNTADRSSDTSVNASVKVNDQQRTRISAAISHLNVQPLTSVNFSLSVGTVVPRDVRLQPLPADVVEIVPQYRGYNFVLVKDEIVIIEPTTYKIVTVLPYSGRSTAAAPQRSEQRKTTFTDRDREVIRRHSKAYPVEREKRVTTGSSVRTVIRAGERVPADVEIEAFPEEVYREAPTLREYRYIHRDSRTYVVDPHERLVIEEID